MTRKTIQFLAAIVVGLVLLSLVLRSSDRYDAALSGRQLLPDFKAVANDITNVRISQPAGTEAVTIHREGDKWVISARDNYAADIGKLRQLIIALADAEIVEEKTSNPEQYGRLGVDDPEDGGSGSKIVIAGPVLSYSVILGNVAQGNFRYARIAEETTSYLIDQNPDISQSVGDWLLPDIVDFDSIQIRRVSISHADGENIVIEKSDQEQTDFAVLDIPEGRELSYASVGNGISGALAKLDLEDVRARIETTPATTVVYETWEGLKLTAGVVSENEVSWVTFSAEAVSGESAPDSEADEINERLSGWQYQLADYKKNLLTRRWEDILKTANDD